MYSNTKVLEWFVHYSYLNVTRSFNVENFETIRLLN